MYNTPDWGKRLHGRPSGIGIGRFPVAAEAKQKRQIWKKKNLTILFQVWRAFSKNTMAVQVHIDLLLKVVCEAF